MRAFSASTVDTSSCVTLTSFVGDELRVALPVSCAARFSANNSFNLPTSALRSSLEHCKA